MMVPQTGKLLIFVLLIVGAAFAVVRLSNRGLAGSDGRVQVYYPPGDCQTGKIQVERFDRETRRWAPHPDHPLIDAGDCYWEDSGTLFNEVRARCVSLEEGNVRETSEWVVGADFDVPVDGSICSND